jgi:hypothetical protein
MTALFRFVRDTYACLAPPEIVQLVQSVELGDKINSRPKEAIHPETDERLNDIRNRIRGCDDDQQVVN